MQARAQYIADSFENGLLTVRELLEGSRQTQGTEDNGSSGTVEWDENWNRFVCSKGSLKVVPLSPGENLKWEVATSQKVIMAIFVDTKKSLGQLTLDDIEFYQLERWDRIPERRYGPDGSILTDPPEIPWRAA